MFSEVKGMDILKYQNPDYPCTMYWDSPMQNRSRAYLKNYTKEIEVKGSCGNYSLDYLFGVADNPIQIADFHEDFIKSNNVVLTFDIVFFYLQPERHGWRWHKWGEYLGEKMGLYTPKCEYGFDESEEKEWIIHSRNHSMFIDSVMVYSLHLLK